jgi:hypothetical protein
MNRKSKKLSSKILDWWSIILGFGCLFLGIEIIHAGELLVLGGVGTGAGIIIFNGITPTIGAIGMFLLSYFSFRFRFWKKRESKVVSVCLCVMILLFLAAMFIDGFRGKFTSPGISMSGSQNPLAPHTPRLTFPK